MPSPLLTNGIGVVELPLKDMYLSVLNLKSASF